MACIRKLVGMINLTSANILESLERWAISVLFKADAIFYPLPLSYRY